MTEKTTGLATALAQLQTKLPEIKKSETAQVQTKQGSYSYTYAGLATLSDQILPLLGELGMSFTCRPTFTDGRFALIYRLWHVSGEFLEGEYPLPTGGTPQALGSAITYGRRYCLTSVTGVAPEDDDDGAAAEAAASERRGTAQRRQPASAGRTVQRAAPPLPGDGQESITAAQRAKLMAVFADTDRAERLRISSQIVGREVSSANDLTKDEAVKVIDAVAQIRKSTPGAGMGVGEVPIPAPPTDASSADYAGFIRSVGGVEAAIGLAQKAGFRVLSETGLRALTQEQMAKVLEGVNA